MINPGCFVRLETVMGWDGDELVRHDYFVIVYRERPNRMRVACVHMDAPRFPLRQPPRRTTKLKHRKRK